MALVEQSADRWTLVADDAPLPDGPAMVSAARLAEVAGRNGPLGVALAPDQSPDLIAAHLPRLALVQVTLPGPRDGRAFTQIRALREYHCYRGEIRVAGHVIPDHYAKLLRCGASSVLVRDGADPAVWERARGVVDIAYQGAGSPLGGLRRRVA
jgi:uncharacterized protein (DUF934 family)